MSLIKLQESNRDEYPSKIHIYANRPNLGFEDVEDVSPQYSLDLEAKYLEGKEGIPLPLKNLSLWFCKASTLTIYVEESAGGVASSIWGDLDLGASCLMSYFN